jgi:hypothetical protein
MYYQSDWPETGLPAALSESKFADSAASLDNGQDIVQETRVSSATVRWFAAKSGFESSLYGFPIWSLRLEIEDADGSVLGEQLNSTILRETVYQGIRQLFDAPPWSAAYVSSKVVKDEPLYHALRQVGFEEVEHRCLYNCSVGDIVPGQPKFSKERIRLTSLAEVTSERVQSYQAQILNICRAAFEKRGHTRHFIDPVLLERLPGIDYILAVMKLNFEHVLPKHFLVALDTETEQVCGFTAIGRKPGLAEGVYTQLLSATQKAYRGKGIYHGLTQLLSQTLPQHVVLLNVTHADNSAIQRVFQHSGRVHVSDTVVLRRVCGGVSGSIPGT